MKKFKKFKTRKRYRLVFVNDNTLNTVWTMHLTRAKVWGLSALCVAAIAALVVCVVVWSPASYLLPGYMRPEQRRSARGSGRAGRHADDRDCQRARLCRQLA